MHNYNGNYFGMHFTWWIFWVVLIIIIYYIISRNKKNTSKEAPLDILEKRFANGEITKEEFEMSKQALRNKK